MCGFRNVWVFCHVWVMEYLGVSVICVLVFIAFLLCFIIHINLISY